RGYKTVIASAEPYRQICESEGCEFEAVQSSADHKRLMGHPHMWKPLRGLRLFLMDSARGVTRSSYDVIQRHALGEPTALVFNSVMFGALIAREKLALPAINVHHIPFSRISSIEPAKNSPWINFSLGLLGSTGRRLVMGLFKKYLNILVSPVNDLRREVGLEPVRDVIGEWRASTPLNLDLWPDWYSPVKADGPAQVTNTGFVEYSGPAKPGQTWEGQNELQAFLERKPIVFTMGSEMNQDFDAQVKLFAGACETLGTCGVMVSGVVRGKGPMRINDNFYVIDAPYAEIFPKASAILSHGGVGTVARIFALGKPHLVTPLACDHFDNGHLVERLGAGKCIPFHSLNIKKLAAALFELQSSPRIAAACAVLVPKMNNGSATARAADFIEASLQLKSNRTAA
ncbi:MAG: glycosyltransferase, partial [Bdellovibrionales bacterium]